MSQRIEREPAFLLHRRPFRNTSFILSYLTQNHGRVTVVGRGVRSPRSRDRVAAQHFLSLTIAWQGRHDLKTLVSAESTGGYRALDGDLLICGLYMNELLERLVPLYDPHPQIFLAYEETLSALSSGASPEIVLRYFERTLLMDLGYGLMWDKDAVSGLPIEVDSWYSYCPGVGLVQSDVASVRDNDRVLLCSGRSIQAFATGCLSEPDDIRYIKVLMRALIAQQLDHKSLKSKDLFSRPCAVKAEPTPVTCDVT